MNEQVRELLVTASAAEKWSDSFDQKVDELMELVNRADTDQKIQQSCEMLDVYRKKRQKPAKLKKKKLSDCCGKPFEFLVFSN
jgi:hypothetical protein